MRNKERPRGRHASVPPLAVPLCGGGAAGSGAFGARRGARAIRAAASAGLLAEKGFSLQQISKLSSREVATKLFDAVETLTWRAANLQSEDLRRLSEAPLRLWGKRTELPGWILEKGANFFMKNGKSVEN